MPQAAQTLPDTAQGKRVQAYLDAFNAGDEAAFLATMKDLVDPKLIAKRTYDERKQMFQRMRGDFVQTVLTGSSADSEALLQRGRELGYDLRLPHVAMLCTAGEDEASARTAGVVSAALSAIAASATSCVLSANTTAAGGGTVKVDSSRPCCSRTASAVEHWVPKRCCSAGTHSSSSCCLSDWYAGRVGG